MTSTRDQHIDTRTIIWDTAPDGDGVEWALKPRIMRNGPSIIIVGPDGVGKTTVAKRMSEMTGIPTFKCPTEKQIFRNGGRSSLVFDYTLTHFLSQTGYRFISDRGYPCEFVYSLVFERETDMDLLLRIDEAHANLGTKVLYLYSSIQPTEPDDIVPSDKYWDVKKMYDHFVLWTDCEIVQYDTAQSLHLSGREREDFDTLKCLDLLGENGYKP